MGSGMSEEENIPEDRSEVEGARQKAESNEQISETSPDPIPSELNPVRTDIHPGGPQPLKEMEVHHHGHVHEKKKWVEYLLEFLMLFLAVFLGFLAENQREHHVEHLRAKKYAQTLIEDLAGDTTEILDVIREDKIILSCFDSISATIQKRIQNNTVPGSFYYFCNIGTFSPTVVWNNATLTQITQSGSLRYFRNLDLVKKLSSYYSNIDFISNLNNGDTKYRDESIKLRGRVLNNYFYSRYSAYSIIHWLEIPDSLLKATLPLQSNDPELLNEFANSFETRRRVLNLLIDRDYSDALKMADELIKMLRMQYHLE